MNILENYREMKLMLRQKRDMLYQVVSTIDHQNLIQATYESIFQFVVQSAHETLVA